MSRYIFKNTDPSNGVTKIFGILFLAVLCGLFFYSKFYFHTTVTLGNEQFDARIADTATRREKGLSGTEHLGKNEAMLFTFPTATQQSFWMVDMHYAIDIIWLRDGKIVDIASRVPPPDTGTFPVDLPIYTPRLPSDAVVEVVAGTADRLGITIGDSVQIGSKN